MSRLRSARFSRPFEIPLADFGTPADESQASRPQHERADWSALADGELYRAELRRRLVDVLQELPPLYRTPVLLRDVRGLSTGEASAVLRLKPQTLKSRLHRGRLLLREQLAEFSDGLSLHRAAA